MTEVKFPQMSATANVRSGSYKFKPLGPLKDGEKSSKPGEAPPAPAQPEKPAQPDKPAQKPENKPAPPAGGAKAEKPTELELTRSDREFLPAALEILETPPAPKSTAFMMAICAFVLLSLLWSYFGRLDVHAIAWGKIEAQGRAKTVQPFDAGKVIAARVENGAHVKAGEILVELDPSEAQAEQMAASDGLDAAQGEIARRKRAIEIARSGLRTIQMATTRKAGEIRETIFEKAPVIDFRPNAPEKVRAREIAVLTADLGQLGDGLKNIDKQMAQKEAQRQRLQMSIAHQIELMKTLEGRVEMRESSLQRDVGTKINVYDAKEALQKSRSQMASDQGQLIETDAALDELESQKIKAISVFIADNESKLAEADRKSDELTQQLEKARTRLKRTNLVAPIDGIVQQMAVTTIGQVVSPGQQLMLISPENAKLYAYVYVSNLDIAFVKLGQEAEIKVDAFPFTRFGTIKARVEKIAADAIEEQEAKRLQANATASANQQSSPGAPGQPQSFVFPVTLKLESQSVTIEDATAPLSAGMTVTAEIKTDSRRVIDYLLSPLKKLQSEAFKER